MDFIDVIEQNHTHTAWGGRQRVSYDCSLRVKYMEPVKGSPDKEHLGGNNPRASHIFHCTSAFFLGFNSI